MGGSLAYLDSGCRLRNSEHHRIHVDTNDPVRAHDVSCHPRDETRATRNVQHVLASGETALFDEVLCPRHHER